MSIPTAPGLGPLIVDNRPGTLTLNGVNMTGPAWQVCDLYLLWQDADQRGTDRIIPGTPGVLSYPRRANETTYTLPLVVTGYCNQSGTPYSNPYEGLQTNVAYLQTNVTQPVITGAGTVAAVMTMPDATTRTAAVHVGPMRITDRLGPIWLFTIDVQIPSGQLL